MPFGGAVLDAGDVDGGGEELAEEDAEHDDGAQDEFVDDLAFVGHVRRVNGNALLLLAGVQIVLTAC